MVYHILADLVVLVHFGFVLFAVLGGLLVVRWAWMSWVHLPCVAWAALIELVGWVCPLTPLESWLRRRAGGADYEGGFIEHYVLPILYPADLTRGVQVVLGAFVLVVNVLIYAWVVRRHRRSGTAADGPGGARR